MLRSCATKHELSCWLNLWSRNWLIWKPLLRDWLPSEQCIYARTSSRFARLPILMMMQCCPANVQVGLACRHTHFAADRVDVDRDANATQKATACRGTVNFAAYRGTATFVDATPSLNPCKRLRDSHCEHVSARSLLCTRLCLGGRSGFAVFCRGWRRQTQDRD